MSQAGNTVKSMPFLLVVAIVAVIAFLLGWFLMGYVIWPVQYVGDSHSYDLVPAEKEQWVIMVADSYAVTGNLAEATNRLKGWYPQEVLNTLTVADLNLTKAGQTDAAKRVEALAAALKGVAVSATGVPTVVGQATATPAPAQPGLFSISSLLRICVGLLIIFVVIVAVLFVVDRQKRKAKEPGAERVAPTGEAPLPPKPEMGQLGFGHFRTKYSLGDNDYDESFTIETPAGEFLAECGIGISETIEAGPPDRIAAFEVWLFDKSDIRTVTKVLMSEYAYNDPAIRDKLAAKGDAVLAAPGEVFHIETAAFDMEVTVVDLAYGTAGQYPNSYFDSLTTELMAVPRETPA
jgi:hypothetical protein